MLVTSPKEHRVNTGTLASDYYIPKPPDPLRKSGKFGYASDSKPRNCIADGSGEDPQTENLEGYCNVLISDTLGSLCFPKSNFFSL